MHAKGARARPDSDETSPSSGPAFGDVPNLCGPMALLIGGVLDENVAGTETVSG